MVGRRSDGRGDAQRCERWDTPQRAIRRRGDTHKKSRRVRHRRCVEGVSVDFGNTPINSDESRAPTGVGSRTPCREHLTVCTRWDDTHIRKKGDKHDRRTNKTRYAN